MSEQTVQQLIANAKTVDQLPEALAFEAGGYFVFYLPGTGLQKIKKENIVFAGEPPTKSTQLTDMPSVLTGQAGKILVVNQAGTSYEFKVLESVQGATQEWVNEQKFVKTVNFLEPDENGNVTVSTNTTSPNEIITFIKGYTGTGFSFNPYSRFVIDGVTYEDSRPLSADASDPSQERHDEFAIEKATKQIVIIKGTPGSPAPPDIDPLTHIATGVVIDIPAGATQPAGITGEVIFSEGGEWTVNYDNAFFDIANTDNPASGTKAIKTLQPHTVNKALGFTPDNPIPVVPFMDMSYKISNIVGGDHYWIAQGFDSKGRMKSAGLNINNYDPNASGYQFITITIPEILVDLRNLMLVSLSNTFEFYLDDVKLSSGGGSVSSGVTKGYVDGQDQKLSDRIAALEGGSTTSPSGHAAKEYLTVQAMFDDQVNQEEGSLYFVENASGWSTVDSGWAEFVKLATSNAEEADYRKEAEEESMDQTPGSGNTAKGPFSGVFESTGGNAFYDDYITGSVVNLSLGANPVMGETWSVRIKGDLTGSIPVGWNFSGKAITVDPAKMNELTLLYVSEYDIRIVNRIVSVPDTEDPTTPTNLTAANITSTTMDLSWDASTDNVAVEGYKIKKDGVLHDTVYTNAGSITGLTPDTPYTISVLAFDAAGNESGEISISETTAAQATAVYVDWQYENGATDAGNGTIQLSATPNGGFKSGGYGTMAINGDNAVHFKVPTDSTAGQALGLTATYRDLVTNELSTADILILINSANNAMNVNVNGAQVFASNDWTPGSTATLRLTGTTITAEKDGVVFYTAAGTYNTPLTPVAMLKNNGSPYASACVNVELEDDTNIEASTL